MNVRTANPLDIASIMGIESAALSAAHWPAEKYQEIFDAQCASRIALVVEHEGNICGFLVGRLLADEWEIENLAVVWRARRQGFGSALLREFMDRAAARDARTIFLEVRESNVEGRAIYKQFGFIEQGRRTGYYGQPTEDAIVYGFCFESPAANY